MSDQRFRTARRWRAASAVEFAIAAAFFFAGWTVAGLVMLATGLFASLAAYLWERGW